MAKKSRNKDFSLDETLVKVVKKTKQLGIYNYKKNRELVWIVGFMILLLVALFATSSIVKSFNHFNYKTLSFTKEKFGEISVYHYYYYFSKNGKQYQHNLYLRLDPRKNNIPISGETEFYEDTKVFIGINGTGLTGCGNASRDIGSLSSFFVNNLITIKAGTLNKWETNGTNMSYVDCSLYPNNPVIRLFAGNETKIYREEKSNCYNIEISNCNTLAAIEKFEVQSVLDAKTRAKASQA